MRTLSILGAFGGLLLTATSALADDLDLRIPPGFRVTQFADENLANDIYAMTLDAQGRVVVTSRGYIKTLHDTDGDGKADKATLFATTQTGGMGLCFDGPDLYFCGDGWFSRYRDADGDGRADGPPEHFVPLVFTEHGGHAMRKGPDGWWYLIGGNDSAIGPKHATLPGSPIREPQAGALLRLPPDCRGSEVIAHGFRNPYDFDFNAIGDLFTYDSDVERDAFLPWYSPTRIYHVQYAAHHGWRVTGFLRCWARRDDYLDTVNILRPVGRGSPTGVVCYRHDQFPAHYQGGVFALDWTFGKVFFLPLRAEGTSYKTELEVFLEPTGSSGFAPTDAVVAPDGSLFLSIGGRGTRGSVYRIEYVGGSKTRRPVTADLDRVLDAPQPLDAWSRAAWVPAARKLGLEPFLTAVRDESRSEPSRVRAIEIVTELFGGLPVDAARAGARSRSPLVRARVAWSLGRVPCSSLGDVLALLTDDPDARVRLAMLEALADHRAAIAADTLREAAARNLDRADKRVRQASARLAALLPDPAWEALSAKAAKGTPQEQITVGLAFVWRHPDIAIHETGVQIALDALAATSDPALRLQAVRLIVLALGDWHLKNPDVEMDTGYSVQPSLIGQETLAARIRMAVRPLFPSGNARLDEELGRLLAILEDDDPALPSQVASFWTEQSSPTRDLHFLIIFSRLRGPKSGELTARVAHTLLALDRKLEGQQLRTKQTWADRLTELSRRLLDQDPALAEAILRDPGFAMPGHVPIALCLSGESRVRAARLFLAATQKDPETAWPGTLIELLATLPPDEVRPFFRARWDDFALRDALLLKLAAPPEPADRDKFLWGIESDQPQIVLTSLGALEQLPADRSPERLVPLLRGLRRLMLEPRQASLRSRLLALIARQSGRSFAIKEDASHTTALRRAYQPVFDWFAAEHPALAAASSGGSVDLAAWKERLKTVDWSKGDANRGATLFRARGCQTCHTGQRALGPDLTGVTGRFSRDDLLTAILAPSLDVSPLYRTTLFETRDGRVLSGLVAFESADGVILQTGATTTVRIGTPEIAARRASDRSIMPEGLLQDLKPADFADLYRYVQTLTRGAN